MDDTIGFDIVTEQINTLFRRTKIVCTIGPASWSEEGLGKLMDAGMNVARFNFSHGDHEGHKNVLERLRSVAASKSRNVAGEYRRVVRIYICLYFVAVAVAVAAAFIWLCRQ